MELYGLIPRTEGGGKARGKERGRGGNASRIFSLNSLPSIRGGGGEKKEIDTNLLTYL